MISQTILKFLLKPDVCYRQYYYWIIKGGELIKDTPQMRLGRYFEYNLIGSDRSGEPVEPIINRDGKKSIDYKRVDDCVEYAKGVMNSLGIETKIVQEHIQIDGLEGHIDFIGNDIFKKGDAIYDVKLTFTAMDDRWRGWADPDSNEDAKIQATHYVLLKYLQTGKYYPFYFLVFGVNKTSETFWSRVFKYSISEEYMEIHKGRIRKVADILRDQMDKWEVRSNFNKCSSCPFKNICDQKITKPQVETIWI